MKYRLSFISNSSSSSYIILIDKKSPFLEAIQKFVQSTETKSWDEPKTRLYFDESEYRAFEAKNAWLDFSDPEDEEEYNEMPIAKLFHSGEADGKIVMDLSLPYGSEVALDLLEIFMEAAGMTIMDEY